MSRMRIDEVEIRDADIFKILLDSFPDMIHSVDDDGNIVYTNRTAERLLGYTHEELLSMNIRQIYAPEILEIVERGFTDLKERGDKTIPESMLMGKDGTRIPVEIRSFSIYDDQGNFLRTFSILRDIREIKELQQSLIHAGCLAAIGEMATGVAHDINNPLTVILLSNEMAQRELKKRGESDKGLQHVDALLHDIDRASKSIQKLVDHLRNFARGMAEEREVVDLYATFEDALFITKNKITKNGVVAENRTEPGKYFVFASPNNLEQVFVNLCSNACDAMEGCKERKLAISVESCSRGGENYWKCDVSDTGSGIPPELIQEVFHSFFTTKEKGQGTGLGLSISRGIVEDHKGDMDVVSTVGEGTTFAVFLPQSEAPEGTSE